MKLRSKTSNKNVKVQLQVFDVKYGLFLTNCVPNFIQYTDILITLGSAKNKGIMDLKELCYNNTESKLPNHVFFVSTLVQ